MHNKHLLKIFVHPIFISVHVYQTNLPFFHGTLVAHATSNSCAPSTGKWLTSVSTEDKPKSTKKAFSLVLGYLPLAYGWSMKDS
jgi:hypothetical protein